jgi:BMFP domain-containing protein YqiC
MHLGKNSFIMAQSQEPESENRATTSLPERATEYRLEVEKVVREVGEHPLYELKRSCSFRNLADKIEFVKDIQSIATSRIPAEKFLVIGADAATKTFQAVQNLNEFDEAAIRQLLDKYLSPVPDFELFQMTSSDGCPFVLFVIPKQKRRRILAKVTVEDSSASNPKVLLREGDLWTKGASTGKRLAKTEDWDEIYEEVIETEAERRTRQRTAHALELATAREKVRPSFGQSSLPSFFTDEEFQALLEDLCSAEDKARFNVLLERLRDDLVEGWHEVGAYEESSALLANAAASLSALRERTREHIKNVFRPAMHWLTLSGIYVVKNTGPTAFLDSVADLLKEVFDTSHQLLMVRSMVPYGATSDIEEHVSHTVPALESLVSLWLIGAYLAKRNRFQYLRSLFRPDVYRAGQRSGEREKKTLMAFLAARWRLRGTRRTSLPCRQNQPLCQKDRDGFIVSWPVRFGDSRYCGPLSV